MGAIAVGGDDGGLAATDEDGLKVRSGVELLVGGEGADVGFAGLGNGSHSQLGWGGERWRVWCLRRMRSDG